MGIAQLAHAAGESILCHEGWRCGSSQMTLGRTCCSANGKITIRYGYHTSTPRQMKFAGKRLRTERQQNIAMTHTKYTPLQCKTHNAHRHYETISSHYTAAHITAKCCDHCGNFSDQFTANLLLSLLAKERTNLRSRVQCLLIPCTSSCGMGL